MIGRTLAHYEILEKIGSGGMGEVYLAEDTKLDRKVALKVLPFEMATGERRMRFEREAKAVATLDHPNIVTIYSVEEVDRIAFYTMQLVKGKTLTELISRSGLPLGKFFDIAVPLAEAVSAAHGHGVIHRDLKPDNLMLTDDGRLKILDFGLAKLKQESVEPGASELPTQSATEAGRILGSVAYMSPEQAEGKQIDHRTDIFSIGIILYELLAGERPFQGDSPAGILSSIIKDEPRSLSQTRPDVPRDLSKTVARCLAKEPARRLQSALDVRNALEETKQELDSGELQSELPRSKSRSVARAFPWMALAAGLVAAIWWVGARSTLDAEPILTLKNPVQVTSAIGVEDHPTWSPDGEMLAYQSNESGDWDIYVARPGSEPINRTSDYFGSDDVPSWSPDGREIAFRSNRDGSGIFVMPALAGTPRRIESYEYTNSPNWSSDGERLAFVVREQPDLFVEVRTLSTGESRRVKLPGRTAGRYDLRWSPDERFVAFVEASSTFWSPVSRLWLVRLDDGEAFQITDGLTHAWSPQWLPGRDGLFYVSDRAGGMDLWYQSLDRDGRPSGDPRPVTAGVGMRRTAFSADGTKLAYSKGQWVANVWRLPIVAERPATWSDAEQLTFDQAHVSSLDVTRDGERLVLSSDRGGNADLWVMPTSGGELERLTTDPAPEKNPRWSPDGHQIVFESFRSGSRDIWTIPASGGSPKRLTDSSDNDYYPSWSLDGREIVFQSPRSGNYDLWSVPSDGGAPRQVTEHGMNDIMPDFSPDGEWLAFASQRSDVRTIWRVGADGGAPEQVTTVFGQVPRYSPDGRVLYFLADDDNVWEVSFESGAVRQVTDLQGRRGFQEVNLATDGRYVYLAWREDLGDIWVMDVVP